MLSVRPVAFNMCIFSATLAIIWFSQCDVIPQDRAPFGHFNRVSSFPVSRVLVLCCGRKEDQLNGVVNNWDFAGEDALLGTHGVRYFPSMLTHAKEQPNDSQADCRYVSSPTTHPTCGNRIKVTVC